MLITDIHESESGAHTPIEGVQVPSVKVSIDDLSRFQPVSIAY